MDSVGGHGFIATPHIVSGKWGLNSLHDVISSHDIGGKLCGALESLAKLVDINSKEERSILGALVINLGASEFMFGMFGSACDMDLIDVTGIMKCTLKNVEVMPVRREFILKVAKSG